MIDDKIIENLPWRSEERAYIALTKGHLQHIAIHNRRQSILYYQSSVEVQRAWNEYAQLEADIFNANPSLDSYDSTNSVCSWDPDTGNPTSWAPPMRFEDWKRKKYG